ncbi:FtsB family cell division protein [Bacillus benzoevorans]|uniref:Cell division protein DivIC n=1 Tax=Bacillus benzoevorans TaxID=1456 RepID=A0A7X0LYF8_9BACI|nr:septum formation initiator family protein [Bacillus benzoevorans]MBB6447462.1 cell division protein DivIC [Bacillus benzoevorans]
MGAMKKPQITKLKTQYAVQQEEGQLLAARRKKVLIRRLSAFFVLTAVIAFLMVSTVVSQNHAEAKKLEEKEQLEKELAGLKNDEASLKDEIVKLNDDDYIAKLARKEYFLSEKDEIIFTLPKKDNKEETAK